MPVLHKRIALYRKQRLFHQSQALYRGFVAGRGAGKSHAGAIDLLLRAKAGRTYYVLSPTYPMLKDSSLRSFLKVGRMLGILDPLRFKRSPPPEFTLTTGAEILFRSADDPERLRGPNLSGCWLDEASLMDREVYDIVIAALREEGEKGWLSATFTPKGMGHWTYELFGLSRPDTECSHARTSDNPFNPEGFEDLLARQYPSVMAQQELEGLFVDADDAWQVIPNAWVRLAQSRWTETPPKDCDSMGVDVARGGADKTAIERRHGLWFSQPKKYEGQATDDGPKAAGLVMRDRVNDCPVYVDAIGIGSSCYDSLAEKIGRQAIAVNVAESSEEYDHTGKYRLVNVRAAMWWRLRHALDPENFDPAMPIALPPHPDVLMDLTAPRFELATNGIKVEEKIKIKERIGRSPDVGDALCLALWKPRRFRFAIG